MGYKIVSSILRKKHDSATFKGTYILVFNTYFGAWVEM